MKSIVNFLLSLIIVNPIVQRSSAFQQMKLTMSPIEDLPLRMESYKSAFLGTRQ